MAGRDYDFHSHRESQMKASKLKGMPVVSMADGAHIGSVTVVRFDIADLRVSALVLSGKSGEALVPFGSIRSIGSDAVMVESVAETQGVGGQIASDTVHGLSDVMSLSVINAEGTLFGKVKELEINEQDGQLTGLEVHRGGVLGLGGKDHTVSPSAIRNIGPKLVTVEMPTQAGEKSGLS
jgi:sporulation protein YlmC with PRC-barrel domain